MAPDLIAKLIPIVLVTTALASACSQPDTATPDPSVQPTAIDIQGHRGARGLKPENTLPSFESALDLGVTTLEFDLHFTADNDVVIWHDPVVNADKCGLKVGAPVSIPDPDDPSTPKDELAIRALTVAQLRWFDCSRNPDAARFPVQDPSATELAGKDFGIVTLVDLIEFIEVYGASDTKTEAQRDAALTIRFNMETKRRPTDPDTIGDGFDGVNAGPFELRILEIIASHGLRDRVVIQSSDPRSLTAIHAVDAGLSLAILTTDDFRPDEYVAIGASIWSPDYHMATSDRISEAHAVGLKVIPWTVNDEADMKQLMANGVDGIITDRPDIAMERST